MKLYDVMIEKDLKQRTRRFGLEIIRFVRTLPREPASDVIGRQLLRSAVSVGANYRAACRARSRAEFIAKLAIVEEECDESLYWLELVAELSKVTSTSVGELSREANQILAIIVASIKTVRSHLTRKLPDAKSATQN